MRDLVLRVTDERLLAEAGGIVQGMSGSPIIQDGRLIQTPLSAVESLRRETIDPAAALPQSCELEITAPEGDFELALFCRRDGTGGLRLKYDSAAKRCTVDKRGMDRRFNQKVGEVLDMPLETPLRVLRVFIDSSSTEIFANDGEATFTAHTYPTEAERYCAAGGARVHGWAMAASVTDEFVV